MFNDVTDGRDVERRERPGLGNDLREMHPAWYHDCVFGGVNVEGEVLRSGRECVRKIGHNNCPRHAQVEMLVECLLYCVCVVRGKWIRSYGQIGKQGMFQWWVDVVEEACVLWTGMPIVG
eukprot:3986555-Amphidinium_carterae.2